MESLITYFSDMPSTHRLLLLAGGLTLFYILEIAFPLFKNNYHKIEHTGRNIFLTLTSILVNFAMASLLLITSMWVVNNDIGILNWISASLWIVLVVGLLLLDLIGAWLAHWVEHHVKWMWQFHVIHHSDQKIDTTSANRHHPGESVIRFVFTLAAIIIVGAPIWLVFLYQSISVVSSQFTHANIVLPRKLDNILTWFICTPNMHHVHHHYKQPYSDMNYGNIFAIWDRIAGTFIEVDNNKLIYGVDTYNTEESSNLKSILLIPFRGHRESKDYQKDETLETN